jgi:starch synthase (maltosyl-transferring)
MHLLTLRRMKNSEAKSRAVIEQVSPVIDGGLFPIKRIPGEWVNVEADIFGDGHDYLSARLQYRKEGTKKWKEVPMVHQANDRWKAAFRVEDTGFYEYAVLAWIDHGITWLNGFMKKAAAGEPMEVELQIGLKFLERMAEEKGSEQKFIRDTIALLRDSDHYQDAIQVVMGERLREFFESNKLRENLSVSQSFQVLVERKKALFSAWYEFFPRASSPDPGRAGTFRDCEKILPLIAGMGFDTVYFPPIHPIGNSFRKGKNNSTTAMPGEPGSPWAIGNSEGGHKSINPELGNFKDFEKLVNSAEKLGIEIAIDLAYQCSPDHPYVKDHPQWFRWRPDGTVQYAENPPKKYQDVLPIHFENDDWKNLWEELKSIVEFWIGKGIRIFRVDNPHTKPFVFWQWLMAEMRRDYPEVIFLSEAFTRPKIMARLAKVGFQQSYTYFTWRENKQELEQYMHELCGTVSREYFRPNFWPNTPDILPYYLQNTGYTQSAIRFILASTLSSSYGLYGPVFELLENEPMPGKEEYLDSEKYEVRHWDWQTKTPFHNLIKRINLIRKENEAFQNTFNYQPCQTNQDQLMAYFKTSGTNMILVVLNLDPVHKQNGWVQLPLKELRVEEGQVIELEDLLNDKTYHWNKEWNYIELDPAHTLAHIFRIQLYHR